MRKKVYYAHCMAIYGSKQEQDDLKLLTSMGFRVINPNSYRNSLKSRKMRSEGKTGSQIMDYFISIVKTCDGLAFRSLPEDHSISAGVGKEIQTMCDKGGFVFELPYLENRKTMSVSETLTYLRKN